MEYILDLVKVILDHSFIWMLLIIITGFTKLSKEAEEEENFTIKMIGFYFLGGFVFNFDGFTSFKIVIPVGFIIYSVFMKDKDRVNKTVKKKSVQFGFVMMCVAVFTSFINEIIEYRDISISEISPNVSSINEEWIKINEELEIGRNSILVRFDLVYDKNNRVKSISYDIVSYDQNKYYSINKVKNKYVVTVSKFVYENQDMFFTPDNYVEKYVDTSKFIKAVNKIEFKDSNKNKKIDEYKIYFRNAETYIYPDSNDSNSSIYMVDIWDNYSLKKLEKTDLPIEGAIINYAPMERISEGSTSSVRVDRYVLYIN